MAAVNPSHPVVHYGEVSCLIKKPRWLSHPIKKEGEKEEDFHVGLRIYYNQATLAYTQSTIKSVIKAIYRIFTEQKKNHDLLKSEYDTHLEKFRFFGKRFHYLSDIKSIETQLEEDWNTFKLANKDVSALREMKKSVDMAQKIIDSASKVSVSDEEQALLVKNQLSDLVNGKLPNEKCPPMILIYRSRMEQTSVTCHKMVLIENVVYTLQEFTKIFNAFIPAPNSRTSPEVSRLQCNILINLFKRAKGVIHELENNSLQNIPKIIAEFVSCQSNALVEAQAIKDKKIKLMNAKGN